MPFASGGADHQRIGEVLRIPEDYPGEVPFHGMELGGANDFVRRFELNVGAFRWFSNLRTLAKTKCEHH